MATTYLNRTPSSEGNRKTWTFSTWFKVGNITSGAFFTAGASGQDEMTIRLEESGGNLRIDWQLYKVSNTSTIGRLVTNKVFRDPAAWYHLVCRYDSTNSTAGDRMRMYINGVEETSFSTDTNPTLNYDAMVNNTVIHNIGRQSWNNSGYFDGYLSQTILADGQSYAPTVFGSTNANGVWVPNTSPSVTYGTNGFKIDYAGTGTSADANGFGADSSGQTNHYTSNNLGTNPNTKDTPHNLFCTMTPLDKGSNAGTLSLGNLKMTNGTSGSADNQKFRGTMGVTKGKWYFEMKKLANTASIGLLATEEKINQTSASGMLVEYLHQGELRFWNGSSRVTKTTGVNSYTTDDIVGCALDMDNRRAYFHKNGVYQGDPTPDPASSPSGAGQMAAILANFTMSPCFMDDTTASAGQAAMNFGAPAYTIASGNADANGYGNFEYAVPSGYYALCTKNLAQYG